MKLFHVFDDDKDGFISEEQFRLLMTGINGYESPKQTVEDIMKNSGCTLRINMASVIEWFESGNASDSRSLRPSVCSGLPKASVVPASCIVQSGLEQRQESAEVLSVEPCGENDNISIAFPVNKGWKCKLQWVLTIPLIFPLWCTLFDVREKKFEKYYGLTFIGSMIWLGIFSFLMV